MPEETKEHAKKSFGKSEKVLVTVSLLLVVVALLAAGYFYSQYQKSQRLLQNPTLAAQLQTQDLVGKVGSLIDLPKDELPTIATVSDINKLKDQPFFTNAKNGDKVLIYTKAKKAILYDPTTNKIVDVAPVNLGGNPTAAQPVVTPTPTKKSAK